MPRNCGDRLAAAEPGRLRRHREHGVVGQQRRERIDVVALPGVYVAVDDATQGGVVERPQRRLLVLLGQALVDGLVGALQGAVDRGGRCLEYLGGFARRETEHVTEDQHRPLSRRQVLQRGDEGELDALAQLIARVGRGVPVPQPEPLVGDRLDPHRLDQRLARRVAGLGRWPVVDRQHPLRAPLDDLQRGVGRDPVQPGAQ